MAQESRPNLLGVCECTVVCLNPTVVKEMKHNSKATNGGPSTQEAELKWLARHARLPSIQDFTKVCAHLTHVFQLAHSGRHYEPLLYQTQV